MSKPPAASSTGKPSTATTKRSPIATAWLRIQSSMTGLLRKIGSAWMEMLHGESIEKPKVVLSRDWSAICSKCSIHILPVLATTVLAYLNIRGYFIGSSLQGLTGDVAQDIDRLCLQVTAKLFELLVVASLGVMLVDAIRDKLLFGSEGVPLGLVLANVRFSDASYLLTHDFRAGWSGFKRVRTRILFCILIVACSVIGLFVGPASALLIIPEYYDNWPAGGASFWLHGDLFPSVIEVDNRLRENCRLIKANESLLLVPNEDLTFCPWAGYHALTAELMQRVLSVEHDLSYTVGTFRQQLSIDWDLRSAFYHKHSARVWVTATNIAIGSFSRYISQVSWTMAMWLAKETQPGNYLASLKYRDRGETTATVEGKMPLVRAQCFLVEDWSVPDAALVTVLTNKSTVLPFPIMPESAGIDDYAFFLPVDTTDATSTEATWIPAPQTTSPTSFGTTSPDYPSALLLIRRPGLSFSSSDITCSVQAHWVHGKNVASNVAWAFVQATESKGVVDPDVKVAVEKWGGSSIKSFSMPPVEKNPRPWQHVTLDWEWLQLLTPAIEPANSGRNTLALLLESVIRASNYTGFTAGDSETEESNMFIKIGTIVASFVADGMSRTGWEQNIVRDLDNSNVWNIADGSFAGWNWQAQDWDQVYSQLIKGTASLVPNLQQEGEGRAYKLDVAIKGYGLKASSTAYWLALTILFSHSCLVFGHVAYTIYRRRVSTAWSSVTDFVVLAQTSPPPADGALKHCSTGVRTHEVLRKQLRVRATASGAAVGEEELRLVVGRDDGEKAELGRAYRSCSP